MTTTRTKKTRDFPFTKTLPVARFYYRGRSHTHPVRRTVLLIESTPTHLRGYEVREGTIVRNFNKAPIKSFKRNAIAKVRSLKTSNPLRRKATKPRDLVKSTLVRQTLANFVKEGI